MGEAMKLFYGICIIVMLALVEITIMMRSESTSFYGVADAQEILINDRFAVEIKKIYVVPGQRVIAGDTLLEVLRPELDMKIAELSRLLDELKIQKNAHVNLSRSEVLQYKTQQDARAAELRAKINELEIQLETNRNLVAELRSFKKGDLGTNQSFETSTPAAIEIAQLKNELTFVLDSAHINMRRFNNQLLYAGEPLAQRVKGLELELAILLDEKNHSFKTAQISGLIGEVNFKEGDKLSPFISIMTLHSASPSYVHGYIHENTYASVTLADTASVSSLSGNPCVITGEVVGVGARIVEYPVRLRKTPEMQMWGRDVTIRISAENRFLLGEKVLISFPLKSKRNIP